jgi:hypothetical protein
MIFKKNSPKFPLISAWVTTVYWIVAAVGEHVIAEDALAGGDEDVGVDKSADCGIVITGLQIIESGISSGIVAIGVVRCGCGGYIIA